MVSSNLANEDGECGIDGASEIASKPSSLSFNHRCYTFGKLDGLSMRALEQEPLY